MFLMACCPDPIPELRLKSGGAAVLGRHGKKSANALNHSGLFGGVGGHDVIALALSLPVAVPTLPAPAEVAPAGS